MKTLLIFSLILTFSSISAQEMTSILNEETTESNFANIELFPNPTSEIIFIRNGNRIDEYVIYNLQGQIVQHGKNNAQIISLIDLPIGSYFIDLSIDGKTERRRIQKH